MASTRYYPVQGGGGEGEGTSILAKEPISCLGYPLPILSPGYRPDWGTPERTWNQRLGKGPGAGYSSRKDLAWMYPSDRHWDQRPGKEPDIGVPPPPPGTDKQTPVKTLPCHRTYTAVKIWNLCILTNHCCNSDLRPTPDFGQNYQASDFRIINNWLIWAHIIL